MSTAHKSEEYIIEHSTLYKNLIVKTCERLRANSLTLNECKTFSCNDIVSNLTTIKTENFITTLNKNQKFCYLVRVDTTPLSKYFPRDYFRAFEKREFIAFSTITEENLSHYENKNRKFMFAYEIPAEAIVHIFPCDSNTYTLATHEEVLTQFPSFWWSLDELNDYTKKLGVYNQITCKTKINGKILKPKALIVIGKVTEQAKKVANDFNLNIIQIEPKENVVCYNDDLFLDVIKLPEVSKKMEKDLDVRLHDEDMS